MNDDRGATAPDKDQTTGPVRGAAPGFPESSDASGEDIVETLMTGGGGGAAPIDEVYPGHTKEEEARPAHTGLSTPAGVSGNTPNDAGKGTHGDNDAGPS